MSPSNNDFILAVEGLTVSFDGFKAVNHQRGDGVEVDLRTGSHGAEDRGRNRISPVRR